MSSFYRIKKDSRFLAFIGLAFALFLSMLFMIIGFGINTEDRFDLVVRWVFGIAGVALFIIFFRGAWMITKGTLTHVLSIDENEFRWGFIGYEKSIPVKDLKEIHWIEMDGLHVSIITKYNQKFRMPYVENVLSSKSRVAFLDYMKANHQNIRIIKN
jgi:hypothetical protein